jgi:hypothetical protein
MGGLDLAWLILGKMCDPATEWGGLNFDLGDLVSVLTDSEVSGYVTVGWLLWGGLQTFKTG